MRREEPGSTPAPPVCFYKALSALPKEIRERLRSTPEFSHKGDPKRFPWPACRAAYALAAEDLIDDIRSKGYSVVERPTEYYGEFFMENAGPPLPFEGPHHGVHIRRWKNPHEADGWSLPAISVECYPGYAGIGVGLTPEEASGLGQALVRAAEEAETLGAFQERKRELNQFFAEVGLPEDWIHEGNNGYFHGGLGISVYLSLEGNLWYAQFESRGTDFVVPIDEEGGTPVQAVKRLLYRLESFREDLKKKLDLIDQMDWASLVEDEWAGIR